MGLKHTPCTWKGLVHLDVVHDKSRFEMANLPNKRDEKHTKLCGFLIISLNSKTTLNTRSRWKPKKTN
ncbi:hypothetical protein Hdeb2414_s0006g00209181 [Helianthus debilis subsp. tardiflorus]